MFHRGSSMCATRPRRRRFRDCLFRPRRARRRTRPSATSAGASARTTRLTSRPPRNPIPISPATHTSTRACSVTTFATGRIRASWRTSSRLRAASSTSGTATTAPSTTCSSNGIERSSGSEPIPVYMPSRLPLSASRSSGRCPSRNGRFPGSMPGSPDRKLEGTLETPVLNRFGNVGHGYRRFAREVGYRTGELEHPVVGARREMELADSLSQQRAGSFFCRAEALDFARAQPGVALALARKLSLVRLFHALPHPCRLLAATGVDEFVFAHGGHLDLDVDAIKERP